MSYLKAGDIVSGQEAVANIVVYNKDGSTTVEPLFYAKNLEATVEIEKTEIYTLGKRGAQNKPNGWKGSGNMTIYYVTTRFRDMVLNYIKNGYLASFDLTVTNNDPGSTIGAQTVVLKGCTLDSVIVAKFDTESEALDESVDFTFDDLDILKKFTKPALG